MTDTEYNAVIREVVKQLKAAGIDACVDSSHGVRTSIKLKNGGHEHYFIAFEKASGLGVRRTYSLAGFTVRWDYGGMGVSRFQIRKDGTIDTSRLKADLEQFAARAKRAAEARSAVEANQQAMAGEFNEVRAFASKLAGSGLFVSVSNDGAVAGSLQFKLSGHITPSRARAILTAIIATKED